jgi:hypothetical protein
MSAKLLQLGELEKTFLTTVNWMEVVHNLPNGADYLTNPTAENVYVVDVDLEHFGVTLMGIPSKTEEFRNVLSHTMENVMEEYAQRESWRSISFS